MTHRGLAVRRILSVITVTVVVVALTPPVRTPVLKLIGHALVIDEPISQADVVVVPEWTQAAGVLEAADLVRQGHARAIAILLGEVEPAERELIRRGLASPQRTSWLVSLARNLEVQVVEAVDGGNGTEAESRMLPDWCRERGFRTVIVVSLPDHSRRLRRLLNRSMADHPTRAIVRTTRYASYDPDSWWTTRGGVRIQLQEGQKLLLDFLQHPFP